MSKKIVISDIHGMFLMLTELLKKVNYDRSRDELIIIGDLVDRGPHSKEVISFLLKLKHQGACMTLIKGNHDDMFLRCLTGTTDRLLNLHGWIRNGGFETLASYGQPPSDTDDLLKGLDHIKNEYPDHVKLLESMALYHEDEDFIYVHGGINPVLKDWRKTSEEDLLWIRDEFIMAPIQSNLNGKTVVFGHTPVQGIHGKHNIWFSPCDTKIGIDGGAARAEQLNALVIEKQNISTESVKHHKAYQLQL